MTADIRTILAAMADGNPKGKVPIAALRAAAEAELGLAGAAFDRAPIGLDDDGRARLVATSLGARAWAEYHGLPAADYLAGIAGEGEHYTHVEI